MATAKAKTPKHTLATYFVFRLSWSQTDQSTVIVQSDTEANARKKILGDACYIDCIGVADRLIN